MSVLRFVAAGMRCTPVGEMPTRRAISRLDQCAAPSGTSSRLRTTTSSTWASVMVRGAPGRGSSPSPSSRRAQDRWQAAKLDELLDDGMSPHEFILRFTLSHPGVSSAIVGTSNPEHLRSKVAAASRGPLAEDLYAEARSAAPASPTDTRALLSSRVGVRNEGGAGRCGFR